MHVLTDNEITFLRLNGIPKESAEIVSDYFPKDNEDFGKNFGQSSPYDLKDPRRFFNKIFEMMDKYFDIHLDFVSHGCGDSYIVNPDIDFQVVKEEFNFDPKNNYLIGGYGKYSKNFGYNGVKRWNLILKK